MIRKITTLVAIALAVLILPLMAACSSDPEPTAVPAADIEITDAWARPAAMIMADDSMDMGDDDMDMGESMAMGPAGGTGAVYFKMTNSGDAPDTLIKVIDAKVQTTGDLSGMVELHETTMADGVMTMHKLDAGMKVLAGATVELKPGGLHVMMMNIKRELKPGDTVTLVLGFESGDEKTITAEVREP